MSGLGLLVYLVKHSRTELSNAVCERSKCMYETNMSHYKARLCTIKHLVDKKYYFYQMKPDGNINVPWDLCGYSNVDYIGYNDT